MLPVLCGHVKAEIYSCDGGASADASCVMQINSVLLVVNPVGKHLLNFKHIFRVLSFIIVWNWNPEILFDSVLFVPRRICLLTYSSLCHFVVWLNAQNCGCSWLLRDRLDINLEKWVRPKNKIKWIIFFTDFIEVKPMQECSVRFLNHPIDNLHLILYFPLGIDTLA